MAPDTLGSSCRLLSASRDRVLVPAIASALAASSERGSLRTGFAELAGDETAAELIARADSQLIDSQRGH